MNENSDLDGGPAEAPLPHMDPQPPRPYAPPPPRTEHTSPLVEAVKEAMSEDRVVNTSSDAEAGLNKCPNCGSSEVRFRQRDSMLQCMYCRHSWSEETVESKYGLDTPIHELDGDVLGSGTHDIDPNAAAIITIKCGGCGAEVIINTDSHVQSRCHWCRQTLSLNEQIPNGAVPDAILPFQLNKEEAVAKISAFAGSRRFFAHKQFKREFKPDNVVGVYLPYMVIDGNLHAAIQGVGEILVRRYQKGNGDNKTTYYDADAYAIRREFDMAIDDLTLESSEERSNMNVDVSTNNIINTILPFDIKNAVAYNSNYLKDFTSEKRDLNVAGLKPRAMDQFLSIARAKASAECDVYDRGVRWEKERVDVKGTRWVSVYLPVWLYSYYETRGDAHYVHYIAVNGRTGETMGSVPINGAKLLGVSFAIGILTSFLAGVLILTGGGAAEEPVNYAPPPVQQPYDPLQESSRY